MALLALSDLVIGVDRRVANDDRDFAQAALQRGAQSLGAEVKAVAALRVGGMRNEGLQDAALANVVGEFVDLGVGELGAGCSGLRRSG